MEQLSHYSLYRKVVTAYLIAHWTLVSEYRAMIRREQPSHLWIPFRDRATGAVVTARWEPDPEAEDGGAWEVAGQAERVAASHAMGHWTTL